MVARIIYTLHERIASKHLPAVTSNAALDSLLESSSALVESIDDLTSTLYGPQDPTAISNALRELADAKETLHKRLYDAIGVSAPSVNKGLDERMEALSIEVPVGGTSKDVKWLDSCFAQVNKSIEVVL